MNSELLIEIKNRLVKICLFFIATLTIFIIFSNNLYSFIAKPVFNILGQNQISLISTTVTGGFMIPIKLAIYCAVIASFPVFCYQAWSFIAPALYTQEKRKYIIFVLLSNALFYLGIAFAISFLAPTALKFFLNSAPNKVAVSLEIANYLDFILKVVLGAAVSFQIPVILIFMVNKKIVNQQQLKSFRKYFIVLSLIIGMICTPPDVVSQLILAIPLMLCYEIILLFADKKMPRL